MRYAKWSVFFPEGSVEGKTPEESLREKGYDAFGLLHISNSMIIGCVSENADLTGYENFNLEEITKEEVVNLLNTLNPSVELLENGTLYSPYSKE